MRRLAFILIRMMLATVSLVIFIMKSFFVFQAEGVVVGAFVMPHGKQYKHILINYNRLCLCRIEITNYVG